MDDTEPVNYRDRNNGSRPKNKGAPSPNVGGQVRISPKYNDKIKDERFVKPVNHLFIVKPIKYESLNIAN
jgi:hypothetical protein